MAFIDKNTLIAVMIGSLSILIGCSKSEESKSSSAPAAPTQQVAAQAQTTEAAAEAATEPATETTTEATMNFVLGNWRVASLTEINEDGSRENVEIPASSSDELQILINFTDTDMTISKYCFDLNGIPHHYFSLGLATYLQDRVHIEGTGTVLVSECNRRVSINTGDYSIRLNSEGRLIFSTFGSNSDVIMVLERVTGSSTAENATSSQAAVQAESAE